MSDRPAPAHEAEWTKLSPSQRGAWLGLLRAHRVVTEELDRELGERHGLTLREWDALVRIASHANGVRMKDLASVVVLTASGLTRLMDRLEARGFVARHAGAEDARESIVSLTPKGRNLLASAAPTHNAALRRAFLDHLSARELSELARILEKLPDE